MLPAIAAIVSSLIANNLPKLAQGVIDKGVEFVENKVGVKLTPDPTPEELAKLREAEIEFEKFKIQEDNKNTADARAMQVAALNQTDTFAKRFVYYFTAGWSLFSAVYIAMITILPIPTANLRFVDTVLGFLLGTVIATAVNYFLGSSRGSAIKTETEAMKQELQLLVRKDTDNAAK
jgi:hypothetical protein